MAIDHKSLARLIDKMPAFPESVSKILAMTAKDDVSPKELVAVVERDMVMTVRVLKLVNSPLFGLVREVTSVQHAVVYVGIDTIKNLAISIAMAGSLPKSNEAGLDMDTFWLQSLSVGVIAKLLADKTGVPKFESADYFVAGLLHNIGKITFAYFYPQDYEMALTSAAKEERPDHQFEKQLFAIDHCELGSMLAHEWQLPEHLARAIRNHHHLDDAALEEPLSMAIFCASQIYHLKNQNLREQLPIPSAVEKWLGQTIEETLESLADLDDEINKAKVFIQQ